MKMRNKAVMMLLACLLGASLLTACGGSGGAGPAANEQGGSAATEAAGEAGSAAKDEAKTQEPEKSDEEMLTETARGDEERDYKAELTQTLTETLKANEQVVTIMENAGLKVEDYAAAIIDHVDISPGDVTVNGDKGTVKLNMTMPDFEKFNDYQDEKLEVWMKENDASKMSEKERYKAFGNIMLEIAKDPELPVKTESFDLTFTKKDGQWVADDADGMSNAIASAFGASEEAES